MSRDHLIALGGGLVCALLYLSVMVGSNGDVLKFYLWPHSLLPPFLLFLVGLSLGLVPVLIASATAAAGIAAGADFAAAGLFIVLNAIPVLILVRQGLLSRPGAQAGKAEWYPPGLLLGWLTGYGFVIYGFFILAFLGTEAGPQGVVQRFAETTFGPVWAGVTDPRLDVLKLVFNRYLPALILNAWLIVTLVGAALAQAVLTRVKRNRRPSPRYIHLELPPWLTIGLALAMLASFAPGQIGITGQNSAMIIVQPFFFLGLAVIHALSYRFGGRSFVLTGVYLLLVVVNWLAILVAVLGIIEQWVRFRQRFAATGTGREIE